VEAALTAAVIVAGLAMSLALPLVLLGVAERQAWPRRIRFLCTAHHLQLGALSVPVSWFVEATIDAVAEGAGAHLASVSSHGSERLMIGGPWSADDLRRLRHWQAEAIPVVLSQSSGPIVEVHGPTGVVQATVAAG
jgi:hypothetical protein